MSKFNLTDYILNESLSSSILQNEILNEPSGFFKYMKLGTKKKIHDHPNSYMQTTTRNVYTDAQDIIKQIRNVTAQLFGDYTTDYLLTDRYMRGKEFIDAQDPMTKDAVTKVYAELSDNELIRINKKYNEDIKLFLQKVKNLFNRPNGELLQLMLKNQKNSSDDMVYDLLSITDNQFKKYTFKDIKQSKDNFKDWYKNGQCVVLYFTHNGYFLGSSCGNSIQVVNPLIKYSTNDSSIEETNNFKQVKEIQSNYDVNGIANVIKTKCNNSNKILYWPIPKDIAQYKQGSLLYMMKNEFNIKTQLFQYKKPAVGDITYSASNVRQQMNWGYNKEDYVIVYNPLKNLSGTTFDYESDYGLTKTKKYTKERQHEYRSSLSFQQRYNNCYDSLYRMQPYRIGSRSQLVTIYDPRESKFKQTEIYDCTYSGADYTNSAKDIIFSDNIDYYAQEARTRYLERLKQFKALKASDKVIDTYKDLIYKAQIRLQSIITEMQQYSNQIRKLLITKKLTPDEYKELKILLYGDLKFSETYPQLESARDTRLSLQGLQKLINHYISAIGAASQIYDKILEKSNELKNIKNDEATHNIDIIFAHNTKISREKVNKQYEINNALERASELITESLQKVYYDDIIFLLDEVKTILQKHNKNN